eukprot:318868-Rhodomonas_salina.1
MKIQEAQSMNLMVIGSRREDVKVQPEPLRGRQGLSSIVSWVGCCWTWEGLHVGQAEPRQHTCPAVPRGAKRKQVQGHWPYTCKSSPQQSTGGRRTV